MNEPRRHGRLDREVRLELEHHLAASTEYFMEQGLPADQARDEAVRRLGSIDDAHRRLYPYAREREVRMQLRQWLESFVQDARYAGRALGRERGFTALIVLTLALGIGVNAAMFGVVDRLLLRGPDHVRDADRVMRVYYTSRRSGSPPRTFAPNGYAAYTALLERVTSFDGVAAYGAASEMSLGEGPGAERVRVGSATWTLFPLLGVRPAQGRFFGAQEDRPPRGEPVAVLSNGLWVRRFGADPAAIGRRIVLQGKSYTAIGVAPRGFTGPELTPVDVWIPVSTGYAPRPDWPTTWSAKWLQTVGRLKPGVSVETASAEVTAVYRGAYAGTQAWERELELSVRPLRYGRDGTEPMEAPVTRWVAGVALIVLLVACANVANLLLARGVARRRELAVRTALGITRGRLARLLAAEIVVLAGAGAIPALVVAHWGGHLMRSVLLPDVAWRGPVLDIRVLMFLAAATLLTAVAIGIVPLLQATRGPLTDSLKEGAPQAGKARSRLQHALTVAQAALSVVLLVGAGLFVQSLGRVQALDLGIQPDRVLAVSLRWQPLESLPPEQRPAERSRRSSFLERVLPRLRAVPGVDSASAAIGVPFTSSFSIALRVPGMDDLPDLPGGGPYVSAVTRDYFRTAGTDLLRGRVFTDDDGPGTERVAIVNETMARTLWPGEDALGKCLLIATDPCSRIVGVVENARRFELQEDPAMQFYVPVGQERGIGGSLLLVRPSDRDGLTAAALRRELFALDPALSDVTVQSLQQTLDPQVRPWRLGAALFVGFGGLAFLIAAVGLYSVMAYWTSQRTHEMGVRMALGARAADVVRLVVVTGLATAATGIGVGVLLALAAGPQLEPLLFDTSPRSPVVFATVIAVLVCSAIVATVVPAKRAARVDPAATLRT